MLAIKVDANEYLNRKLAQKCLESGCDAPLLEGSARCERHDAACKARQRASIARRRKRFGRREGGARCKRCGAPRERYKPCRKCAIERAELAKLNLPPEITDTEKAARIAAATWIDPDGRVRYRGQMKRGQQPHSELNKQDFQWTDECLRAFKAGVRLLDDPLSKDWDREERARVKAATANQGERAARHIGDVVQRLKPAKRGRRDEDE